MPTDDTALVTPTQHARAAELAALCDIGSAMLSTLDVDAVLERVCENAVRLLDGSGACITEYREDEGVFLVKTAAGSFVPALGHTFPAKYSHSARALREGRTVIDNDVPGGPAASVAAALPVPIERALIARLSGRERILGTLVLIAGKDREPFSEADAGLLSAFAAQAALAVENARLYQTEKARAQELELLRRQREEQIQRLHDLHAASVAVSSDLDLEELLQRVADEARRLTGAEYGAMGILDEKGTSLARFITSGLPPEVAQAMGPPPRGHGLLGAVIRERRTLRLHGPELARRSTGVPPGHPIPRSFLGVPVQVRDQVIGNLYLINKGGGEPFTDQDETILKMLAAQAAVSIENARLFAEKERLLAELNTAQRARNRLYAYVNHDLRNALHGVSLWAERLEQATESAQSQGLDTQEVAEMARKILRGSGHALRLVRDVLDLARLEEGQLQTWPRRVLVRDLLDAALDAIAPEADRRQVRVRLDPPPPRLEMVADPDRVLQIVVNLLSNAVKFSSAGSQVTLAARLGEPPPEGPAPDKEGVLFWVDDQGPGIAPEHLEAIWGEFIQINPEPGERGLGIGLTLSKQLAQHLGGTLTVRSTPGQGSRFTLWLPRGQVPQLRNGWIG